MQRIDGEGAVFITGGGAVIRRRLREDEELRLRQRKNLHLKRQRMNLHLRRQKKKDLRPTSRGQTRRKACTE